MGKNNRTRRKEKLARRARSVRRILNARDRSENNVTSLAVAYHQVVFSGLSAETADAIDAATAEPRATRRAYWSAPERVGVWSGEPAWTLLSEYLQTVEAAIRSIVECHSVYYWVHLYRRIGLGLHRSLDNIRDERTLYLVRNILEVAFVRYGKIDGSVSDVGLSSEISFEEVAGGLFARELRRAALERGESEESLAAFRTTFSESEQWVLTQLTADDYVDVYRLEALAYEYWLTTARMRRVGKGGSISAPTEGDLSGIGSDEDDFERLIRSYDERIDAGRFDASSIGVAFYPTPASGELRALLASYNVDKHAWAKVCGFKEAKPYVELVTNFLLRPISLSSYASAHSFADEAFRRARGFSLASLCGYLSAITYLEMAGCIRKSGDARLFALLQLYQRAYVVRKTEGYADELTGTAIALMDEWLGAGKHQMLADAPSVHEFLTLRPEKRKAQGLWSLGPRYTFVQHGPATVVDLQGVSLILRNAFFGVSYDQGAKGPLFEEAFRRYVADAGLELFPERILKNGTAEREADAVVRCGRTVFLCECRAMERPLDFELGRVRTIAARTKVLDEKLDQVLTLAAFVKATPKGLNYDFSWATRVVPLVVSPFIEWIWALDERLWLDEKTPRILSANEAVALMEAETL
jgi:hypothetical protein